MCAQNSTYSLFIPGFVLCTNPFLFRIKIANELSEFRNYLTCRYYNSFNVLFFRAIPPLTYKMKQALSKFQEITTNFKFI